MHRRSRLVLWVEEVDGARRAGAVTRQREATAADDLGRSSAPHRRNWIDLQPADQQGLFDRMAIRSEQAPVECRNPFQLDREFERRSRVVRRIDLQNRVRIVSATARAAITEFAVTDLLVRVIGRRSVNEEMAWARQNGNCKRSVRVTQRNSGPSGDDILARSPPSLCRGQVLNRGVRDRLSIGIQNLAAHQYAAR